MKLPKLDWGNAGELLVTIDDEVVLKKLMERERSGQNRIKLVMRIYSRYSKVRRSREEREIVGK
jgi:hypothetical protein